MAVSIIATVIGLCPTLCCINAIIGFIAIYFSSQVKKKYEAGDYDGAVSASKNAKILAYISIGLFVAGIIISILTYDAEKNAEIQEQIMEMLNQ